MTDNSRFSLDNYEFLQDSYIDDSVVSNSIKLDTLIGEVKEIKMMMSQLLALINRNSSSGTGNFGK